MTAESAVAGTGQDGAAQDRRTAPRFEAKIRIKVKEEAFSGFIVNCSTSGLLVRVIETKADMAAYAQLKGEQVTVSVFYMMHRIGDFPCRLVRAEENDKGKFVAFEYANVPSSLVRKLVSIVENR